MEYGFRWPAHRCPLRLPESMTAEADAAVCAMEVVKCLRAVGIAPQEPATRSIGWDNAQSAAPPTHGHCRLIDGTHLVLAGEKNVAGDPIRATFSVDGHEVTIDCVGVAGVRFDAAGTMCSWRLRGLNDSTPARWRSACRSPSTWPCGATIAGKCTGCCKIGTDRSPSHWRAFPRTGCDWPCRRSVGSERAIVSRYGHECGLGSALNTDAPCIFGADVPSAAKRARPLNGSESEADGRRFKVAATRCAVGC